MRLTCSQKSLAHALAVVSKAVNQNNTLPVLNNVLLKAEGKKFYFAATNLEIAIDYWVDADIKNEGELTIPAKLFSNYVNYLKDEKIDLSAEDGGSIVVKNSDSTIKIKGIPSSEFPPIPTVDSEGEVTLSASAFKTGVNQVVFAASLNTTRPILSGVYFKVDKKTLAMVATDSYRLSEKTLIAKSSKGDISCIIPARTLMELASIIDSSNEADDIKITISKNQILFTFGEIRLTSRLIEGQFPNYQQIIPRESKTKIIFNVGELASALKRVNIFAKENNNKILLKITKSGVLVTTDTTQYGEGQVEIKTTVEGESAEIALNSQYLLEVLGHFGKGDVQLEVGGKTNPVVAKSTQGSDYIHIIMPLKI